MVGRIYEGGQDFAKLRQGGWFYVDKTAFLREWWLGGEAGTGDVTLILRPRRFGKTLMLSTVSRFLSTRYAGCSDLFEDLEVWKDGAMRALQGTVPVVSLSFADVKRKTMGETLRDICDELRRAYRQWDDLADDAGLNASDRREFTRLRDGLGPDDAGRSLKRLCEFVFAATGRPCVVLLDEYDTPMIEAWTEGYWDEAADFMCGFLNATFKTNPCLERGLMTGITRVGKESMFSDLNNMSVFGMTAERYTTSFGFTEEEVFAAMDERGLTDREGVKRMYDGFRFGTATDIYNPWSVTCYLGSQGRLEPWWTDSSSNEMVGRLMRQGNADLKRQFMDLLEGGTVPARLDERIVFSRLADRPSAVWGLLASAGYLKPVARRGAMYELAPVNREVRVMFDGLVQDWFAENRSYNEFIDALMRGDLGRMNRYMNEVAFNCFSFFDTGGAKGAGHRRGTDDSDRTGPERFYHGFVLGLLVDLRGRYVVTSNRESGDGRYDVMLEPRDAVKDDAFIFEFKVLDDLDGERSLEDTVANALAQIETKGYAQTLVARGIPSGRIRKYGFAFRGKKVLIGRGKDGLSSS